MRDEDTFGSEDEAEEENLVLEFREQLQDLKVVSRAKVTQNR
jgi:hypothetical protein